MPIVATIETQVSHQEKSSLMIGKRIILEIEIGECL